MKVYKQKEFAKLINVSERTLVRWDEDGKFVARRNPSNQRFYTEEDFENYIYGKDVFFTEAEALLVLLEMSEDDRENGRTISSKDFKNRLKKRKENMNETEYLQSTENNKSRLAESMAQLKSCEKIELSKEDAIAFIEALEKPAKINKKLLAAAVKYKEMLG